MFIGDTIKKKIYQKIFSIFLVSELSIFSFKITNEDIPQLLFFNLPQQVALHRVREASLVVYI